jgi:2-succinyl-5-enolpyruvyl-6-hydroxy-3-cyclohexene-1-carboxylate synthase
MGSGPDRPSPDPAAGARANGLAALTLLSALQRRGLRHLVLCPGSRSAPLAVAAALLEGQGLRLHTAIDERSAAFFALGLGRALGQPAAVVTTSGTAVAQLLAAAVEADLGTIPLLLLSADRPRRLKNCGANQAVPQEGFLLASCRLLLEGAPAGLATMTRTELEGLAARAMQAACGDGRTSPAGPVHLNLPFEEPLHVDGRDVEALETALPGLTEIPGSRADGEPAAAVATIDADPASAVVASRALDCTLSSSAARPAPPLAGERQCRPEPLPEPRGPGPAMNAADHAAIPPLDPSRPGVVVAGPWRGAPQEWDSHIEALRRWQRRSGWPVLADALSGLRGLPDLALVCAYDLLLDSPGAVPTADQILRLGTLPASRRLQRWLEACGGRQVLISQGDPRRLDPLGVVTPADHWSAGLARWVAGVLGPAPSPADGTAVPAASRALVQHWRELETAAQLALEGELAGREGSGRARISDRGLLASPADAHQGDPNSGRTHEVLIDDGENCSDGPAGLEERPGDGSRGRDGEDAPAGVQRGVARSSAEAFGLPDRHAELPRPSEPWLARALSRLLPPGLPVMLASSSPVRDWESFAAADSPWRPIHGFRGASGIDGTLSIACGLAEACGRLVLVSGDLALLHDANGWLWAHQLRGRLTVVLIENGGGGIFEQLPIRTQPPERLDFERLFAMPQAVDQLALAALHGVPGRRLAQRSDLPGDLAWALEQPFAVLELRSHRRDDAALRQRLRQAAGAAAAASAGRMASPDAERR